LVEPGTYQVKLTVVGKDYTAPLEVKVDPRVKASQADLEKQHEFAVKIRDRVTEVHNTVNQIREARSVLEIIRKRANPATVQAIDAVEVKMGEIEGQLIQVASVNRWAALVYPIMLDAQYAELGNVVEGADSAPPAQTYEVFQLYEQRKDEQMERWKVLQPEITRLKTQ
jgi:hypothetical protein